ncbi:MAG: CRTAC1 family protein [Acidobacteriota bacterium]
MGFWWIALVWACGPAERSDQALHPTVVEQEVGAVEGSSTAPLDGPRFREVGGALGLDFQHRDGRTGQRFYVETAASGGGFIDADGDGRLDLYLVNGARTPGTPPGAPPRNALYLQRDGRFVDVAAAAGVDDLGYGMGLCVADVDGDGGLDLFVTNYGEDRLFLSRGVVDGVPRFAERSAAAGLEGTRWGTGCAFGDVDGDGDLDLYVANYLDFSYDRNPRCGDAARGLASYCRPAVFAGQPDQLYIHQGVGSDGSVRFREEGAARGILQGPEEKGFGVLMSDVDEDGDLDLLVANDGTPNRLYLNDGRGQFDERGIATGVALDRDGAPGAGMGLDLGDVDRDGHLDLIVTNYAHEANTLYLATPEPFFDDRTAEAGLARPSFLSVGWGVRFFDAENDGDLDLAVANGHVLDNIEAFEPRQSYPQRDHLYLNDGGGSFVEVGPRVGDGFAGQRVSRGLAIGDWNDDGRMDVLTTQTNGPATLLENVSAPTGAWIGLRLEGPAPNRSAIGARVRLVELGEAEPQLLGVGEVRSGGSLMSQSDLRLHFGLGPRDAAAEGNPTRRRLARVRWPDGVHSEHLLPGIGRYVPIRHPQLAEVDAP